jgi:hypothetical protein
MQRSSRLDVSSLPSVAIGGGPEEGGAQQHVTRIERRRNPAPYTVRRRRAEGRVSRTPRQCDGAVRRFGRTGPTAPPGVDHPTQGSRTEALVPRSSCDEMAGTSTCLQGHIVILPIRPGSRYLVCGIGAFVSRRRRVSGQRDASRKSHAMPGVIPDVCIFADRTGIPAAPPGKPGQEKLPGRPQQGPN